MNRLFSRMNGIVLVMLSLAAGSLPIRAQIASGPWSRFMGDNYSNGLSTLLGPSLTAGLAFTTSTAQNSVPVIAPNGNIVLTGGNASCYTSAGSLIWSTSYTPPTYPPQVFSSQYGSPTSYPPAIGSDNTVYVTTQSSGGYGYGGSGGYWGIVALDLNATGPGYTVKWAWTTTNFYDAPSYSPVVGADNTVYCVGHRPGTSGSTPAVWAFSAATPGYLKWKWPTNTDSTVITGQWQQPILYSNASGNYIILTGTMNLAPPPNTGWAVTNDLRVTILKDGGTAATVVGDYYFPLYFAHFSGDVSAQYMNNGAPSLSPDASRLIVPWVWSGSGHSYYGIACMNVNIPVGGISLSWPALNSDVRIAPPASAIDAADPAAPVTYSAAIDGLPVGTQNTNAGVYSTTAYGTGLLKRNLQTGLLIWQISDGTALSGQLPALDSAYNLWIGTSAGTVARYDYLTGNLVSAINVIDPVNGHDTGGIGVAIGAGNYLYLTTNNSTTGENLRAVH